MSEIKEDMIIDTNSRSSRAASSRSAGSRTLGERSPIVFGLGSRFNLPPSVVKKLKEAGKIPGFIVYSSGNTEQKENYYGAMDRGWRPLLASEFPELSRQYELSPFSTKEEDQLIRRGGQIAMVRDAEDDQAEKEHYDSENKRQEYMSDMYKQTDPRYPKPFLDERRRERIRS